MAQTGRLGIRLPIISFRTLSNISFVFIDCNKIWDSHDNFVGSLGLVYQTFQNGVWRSIVEHFGMSTKLRETSCS